MIDHNVLIKINYIYAIIIGICINNMINIGFNLTDASFITASVGFSMTNFFR